MPDFDSLTARLNQLNEDLSRPPGSVPLAELNSRFKSLADEMMCTVKQASADLEAEAKAMAADLQAKAAALRAAKAAKPEVAAEPFPHPWEDHQGLDAAQLLRMAETLSLPARLAPGRGGRQDSWFA